MNLDEHRVILGDSLEVMKNLASDSVDVAYLDPPFFTNKLHSSINRTRTTRFSFQDLWDSLDDYSKFLELRLKEIHRILKTTGSIFVHCDKNANFLIRALLNSVFGEEQFRSEINWTYRRWSVAKLNRAMRSKILTNRC